MSEIKFRAWNTHYKVMGYTENVTLHGDYHGPYIAGYIEGMVYPDRGRIGDKGEDIIMQYTGLRDNNGVDIYEGDVVEVYYLDLENGIYSVCFGEYMGRDYHMLCWYLKNNTGLIPLSLAVPCKVIGNIYENPELVP